MAAKQTFYEILTEAVNDMLANGYDSVERVAYWQQRLAEAVDQILMSGAEIDQLLRETLAQAYHRDIEQGQILSRHPGVGRFTIDMIKPELHAELDRRIMAARDLITLNKVQAQEQTQRRFAGWATSIPNGGAKYADRRTEKKRIKKAIGQLPYEQRRVLIDQGLKLNASISEVIAHGGGAIAVIWRSHWRQPGYNARIDHKERDQKVFLLKKSWAKEAGLVKPGDAGYYEDVTAFAQEVNCRCFGIWIYSLGALPDNMVTEKGRAMLKAGRAKRDAMMGSSVAA